MKTIGVLLITVALVAGMVGCQADSDTEPTPTIEHSLTISSSHGGKVTTPGEGVFTYEEGAVVSLVAEAEEGYRFINWTGNIGTVADENAAATTITITGEYEIRADFAAQYSLTISSTTGGSVTMPGEGTFAFDEGEVVHLTAEPEHGYHFVGWAGGGAPIADVTSASTTITMSGKYAITAGFATQRYFLADAYLQLHGPATLPPEERAPCVLLAVMTNMVVDSVRVELPDGGLVIIPAYASVFTPGVDWVDLFGFMTCEPGMPTAGGEYIFTALNADGEPVPEAVGKDIWVEVEPPDPPTNVTAEITEDGILVSWDESPIVPGSFEPAAEPQLGDYQLGITRVETEEVVYGAGGMPKSPHLVPRDKADFTEGRDYGLSLDEMQDGTYRLWTAVHSVAPKGSLGKGCQYTCSDHSQDILFTVEDGEITIG